MCPLTPALRNFIVRRARQQGAGEAAEDVAQQLLLDLLDRPWMAEPKNEGALVQRIRYRVLTQLRGERRRSHWEARAALEQFGVEELHDDGAAGDEEHWL